MLGVDLRICRAFYCSSAAWVRQATRATFGGPDGFLAQIQLVAEPGVWRYFGSKWARQNPFASKSMKVNLASGAVESVW